MGIVTKRQEWTLTLWKARLGRFTRRVGTRVESNPFLSGTLEQRETITSAHRELSDSTCNLARLHTREFKAKNNGGKRQRTEIYRISRAVSGAPPQKGPKLPPSKIPGAGGRGAVLNRRTMLDGLRSPQWNGCRSKGDCVLYRQVGWGSTRFVEKGNSS